jgi:hypothetical protein
MRCQAVDVTMGVRQGLPQDEAAMMSALAAGRGMAREMVNPKSNDRTRIHCGREQSLTLSTGQYCSAGRLNHTPSGFRVTISLHGPLQQTHPMTSLTIPQQLSEAQ